MQIGWQRIYNKIQTIIKTTRTDETLMEEQVKPEIPPLEELDLPTEKTIWNLTKEIGPPEWVEKERKEWERWQKMIVSHPVVLTIPSDPMMADDTPYALHNPIVVPAIKAAHSPQEAYDIIKKLVDKNTADEFSDKFMAMRYDRRMARWPPDTPADAIVAAELADQYIITRFKHRRWGGGEGLLMEKAPMKPMRKAPPMGILK